MPRSEIFENYAKILLKTAEESKALKDYKHDDMPRAGSDTIEVIENLYDTKPDKPKSQQYEHNIMEVAHPNKTILTPPSYDRINALVENNIERQKIIINITQKPVNGHHTQHKYATQDLFMSLVRVANDMDNRNIDDIRKLADTCIDQLHKQADWQDWVKEKGEDVVDIGKGAGVGAIAGGLIGLFGGPGGAFLGAEIGGALGGTLAAIFDTSPKAKNVALNAQEAQEKLADLIKSMPSDVFLASLSNAVSHIIETASQYAAVVDRMHTAPPSDDKAKAATVSIGADYMKEIGNLDRMIEIFLSNAKAGKYAPQESDWLSKVKAPFETLFGDTLDDAVKAFEALERTTKEAVGSILKAQQEAQDLKAQAPEAQPEAAKFEPVKPAPDTRQQTLEDFEKQLAEYEAALKP